LAAIGKSSLSLEVDYATKWRRIRLLYYVGLVLLTYGIAHYRACWILFHRLRWAAPADYVSDVTPQCIHMVQALKEYHRDHGHLPSEIGLLEPDYVKHLGDYPGDVFGNK
jgi:hypothetical protein